VTVLAATGATGAVASATLVAHTDAYAGRAADQRALLAALDERGVRRMYGDYRTCNLVTFATRERVVCAVVSDGLRPGLDRYRPYRDRVAAADRPAYVMPVGHVLDARVRAWLAATGTGYTADVAGGYRIYQPAGSVHPG
jgi:hypothetical protein